jgi:hypothetical protein
MDKKKYLKYKLKYLQQKHKNALKGGSDIVYDLPKDKEKIKNNDIFTIQKITLNDNYKYKTKNEFKLFNNLKIKIIKNLDGVYFTFINYNNIDREDSIILDNEESKIYVKNLLNNNKEIKEIILKFEKNEDTEKERIANIEKDILTLKEQYLKLDKKHKEHFHHMPTTKAIDYTEETDHPYYKKH